MVILKNTQLCGLEHRLCICLLQNGSSYLRLHSGEGGKQVMCKGNQVKKKEVHETNRKLTKISFSYH